MARQTSKRRGALPFLRWTADELKSSSKSFKPKIKALRDGIEVIYAKVVRVFTWI
jgi:hypothetical protein